MVNVLYIGQYGEKGRFTTIQWRCFVEWCKTECNKIILYSRMPYHTVCSRFSPYCVINELEMPDRELNVYAYEMSVNNIMFWDYMKEYNYNIDIDDISHIFFFYGKKLIASLEIVDYENYIFIEEPVDRIDKFLICRELISENIRFCIRGTSDIDHLLRGEIWKPLG